MSTEKTPHVHGSLTLEQISDIINTNFSTPFLEKDLVSSELEEDETEGTLLNINIDRRDISINRSGEVVNSGTMFGDTIRKPDDSIPNCTRWYTPSAAISLWKNSNLPNPSAKENTYNIVIDTFLDEDFSYMISTHTNIWGDEPLTLIREASEALFIIYGEFCEIVTVNDLDTNLPLEEEYTITQAFDSIE